MRFSKLAARLLTLSMGLAIATSAMAQTVPNAADLSLAATLDKSVEPPVAIAFPETIEFGGTADYSLTVTNLGPSIATNVQITAALPDGTSVASATGCTLKTVTATDGTTSLDFPCVVGDILGDVVNNASADVVITLSLDKPTPTPTTCPAATSLAAVSFTVASFATTGAGAVPASTDSVPANNTLVVAAATTGILPIADLAITLDGPASANAGDTVTYSGTLKNNGPCDAAKPRVAWANPGNIELQASSGTTPAGAACDPTWGDPNTSAAKNRCTFPPLPAGESVTFSNVYKILAPPSEVTATASPVNVTASSVVSTDLNSKNDSGDILTITPGNTGCSSTGGALGLVTVLGLLGVAVLRRRRA